MIKTLTATITTAYGRYDIDYKPNNQENNRYAVSGHGATVYLESLEACMAQIEHYDDLAIEQALWYPELEHNS